MGTHSRRDPSKGFQPNGLLPYETTSVVLSIDPERLAKAEDRTAELISHIQPNWSSEKHRDAVAKYVKHLITKCVPCQVFTFGSVPLKTYLPDGDIDLTVFSEDQNLKDNWANEVRDMLEREEKNEHAEFQVKEVQYIKAEVKIIKCLVDNIVVDISFNQLGGLCTLCFLEEADNLISQNHLFKRSIILIKAWCYYESRILGAHHGLISTYALETLVLYTFHVFNNSFIGPLEVLYRFLEFFSKFDWANFCVSLRGPVPISSLPSIAADPPRKDVGELLLNKMFLSACSTAYSVFPGSQETQEQPFVTKHFNVIDPLRVNNNLGRSVNKGNFYRIRSAFSFGAQQLARILECQEENVVAAVNQFFVNTWDRHGKGCRPDAAMVDATHLGQVEPKPGGNLGKHMSSKKPTENFITCIPEIDRSHSYLDSYVQPHIFSVNPMAGTADAPKDVPAYKQKDYNCSTSEVASGWDDRYTQGHDLTKKQQNYTEENCRKQNRGRGKHQFARTYSSPELTNLSSEASSQYMGNVAQEKMEKDTTLLSNYTRWTRGSCTLENRVMNHATDRTSIRHNSKGCDTTFNPNHSFGIYVGNSVGSMPPVCSSGNDSSKTHGEEKDVMNLIPPSEIQNYGGHVHLPVNLSSHQLVQIPPSVLGYNHQIFTGTVPAYSVDSDWGTVMHSSGGPPFPQQFNTVRVISDQADPMVRLNDSAVLAEVDHQDDDCGFWTDNNADSTKEIDPPGEGFSTASSRLSPGSPASSLWKKASSESSWDGKPSTAVKKYHLGKKTCGSKNSIASVSNGWRDDGECVDHNYSDVDDDGKDWVPSESVTSSVTKSHVEVQPLTGLGPVHMNYPSPVLSFAPMIVRPGSQQGGTHNHGVVAFYPAGPPVPFVTMVPVYNVPAQTGTSSAHSRQHVLDPLEPTFPVPRSGYGSDSANHPEKLSNADNHRSMERNTSGEHPGEGGSDIFNSDFASHWKNLQYGRFCQISQLQHHVVYSPSVVVSPQHLQGDLPFNGPKKPSPRSANVFAQVGPVSAQLSSSKTAGVSRRYGGDVSRNRNGTGTYFPNPKILKDHQLSNPRQYRGDYNYDRNEQHGDREANWNFSKPRFTGRAQARYYNEKPNTKMDQSAAHALQADRQWDTFHHNSSHSYGSSNEHFVGTNGHVRNRYWRRGDHQLQNYNADSGPPSPDYASSPRFPGGDGV